MKTVFVCLFLVLSISCFAEERIVHQGENIFTVTITPPAGRAIDARIWYGIDDSEDEQIAASLERQPLNITGYKIRYSRNPNAPVKCNSLVKFRKPIPVQLEPGGSVDVSCDFCESMDAAAFPTVGDVNMVLGDSDGKVCARSKRPKLRMDSVGCYFPGCLNSATVLYTQIYNKSQIDPAMFVGVVDIFFIQP